MQEWEQQSTSLMGWGGLLQIITAFLIKMVAVTLGG